MPLMENGAAVTVTQENKRDYVQLSAEYRLVKSIKSQIDALLDGFYEIIPKELISIVSSQNPNCDFACLDDPSLTSKSLSY